MKNKKFVRIVLIPVFIHMIVFIIMPIVAGLGMSFLDYNPLRSINEFIGFSNFERLLADDNFKIALVNTLVFVLVTVCINIILSLVLAQLINMFKSNKTRSLFRMIFFLPCVAPLVASSVVWGKSIFPTVNGLANMILNALGLSSVNWIGDPSMVMISIIIFTIWADIGYNVILFTAGLDGIPKDYYEAAELDGANGFQKFRYITVPLLGRTFAFVTLMTLISHFQMFAQFSVMILRNGPANSGLVLTSYIYKTAFETKDMGYASAISMVLFIIILGITMVQQKANKVDWEY
ncbi:MULTISPECIES: sugar ABC transporter permease [unclassified Breznakia]|uniref:carbohydrate ABC transporter permease n=1 Tax=unclassified Breznakia TaxID=2623764 RepID=UPI0024767D2B|nr:MULTISPECIES: sugar ABC transporter permease [unclassified Breznakia]MDH6367245.1 multiple sugar transport system permease protein [Breznakia sp. PH1-1]MDH6404424.1 multiple sugar transport system permease protein [Breznakia sp. PF1-11]MDH6412185.1 multiple sugar transport system permease protein [Breznakia sp. PFB1-11]MDH6414412.1 multiple sugar transport system permease protein [Breznakia sp. PFB1-14]MDH6416797.1 multiple sugar transport system permease protein [Breznakia sp. PFB1-4]